MPAFTQTTSSFPGITTFASELEFTSTKKQNMEVDIPIPPLRLSLEHLHSEKAKKADRSFLEVLKIVIPGTSCKGVEDNFEEPAEHVAESAITTPPLPEQITLQPPSPYKTREDRREPRRVVTSVSRDVERWSRMESLRSYESEEASRTTKPPINNLSEVESERRKAEVLRRARARQIGRKLERILSQPDLHLSSSSPVRYGVETGLNRHERATQRQVAANRLMPEHATIEFARTPFLRPLFMGEAPENQGHPVSEVNTHEGTTSHIAVPPISGPVGKSGQ
ncbi:hypothetical protein CPC08DRAFT_420762 [Agrocybe pediades]|nr:hypothetical protein CPC08DRAFT_420762 [Agrocybe pediades]